MKRPLSPDEIEKATREKYSGATYDPATICLTLKADSPVYSDKMLTLRYRSVEELCTPHSRVMDLCCATGGHLLDLSGKIAQGVGVDFSPAFMDQARRQRDERGTGNVSFVQANARRLPFANGGFDVVYSFSSLYYIPSVWEVVTEVARILKPGGHFVGDFGAYYSLNTIVSRVYEKTANTAHPVHLPVARLLSMFGEAGLKIISWRSFQILPMWGDRPTWLKPLLAPAWIRLLQREAKGKMLDQWISSLPGLRRLAFKHVFVVSKV